MEDNNSTQYNNLLPNNSFQDQDEDTPGRVLRFISFFHPIKRYFAITRVKLAILFVVVVVVAFAGYKYYIGEEIRIPFFSGPKYVQAYSLVADKISQSADIIINLPIGIDQAQAKELIVFTPSIAGEWIDSGDDSQLIFKQKEPLRLNRYYTVTLPTPDGVIGKDFLSAENPRVLSILPSNEAETHENSEITIIFNRPIVPLTTLDELDKLDIPVEIFPETAGRFKWSGTRTLQFLPEDTLIASANYTVKIKQGFVSMDGLALEPFEHIFQTRNLRLEYVQDKTLVYSQPMIVKYNQPVDLERMKSGITVEDTEAKNNVEFIAEYGTREYYNQETKKQEEIVDESIIHIYNARDDHGRSRLWNFEKSYYLNIQDAYPKKGDINISEDNGAFRTVTGIIKDVSAQSDRSNHVRPDFFDPQGELIVAFYEDIDINRSSISANDLKAIKYGEKCAEGDDRYFSSCEKVDDKSKILLSFNTSRLTWSKNIKVQFKSIRNTEGLKINPSNIIHDVIVIPKLELLRTIPLNGVSSAELGEITICSNSPLNSPAKEDIDDVLNVSDMYEYKRWGRSYLVTPSNDEYYDCNAGEFETSIYYGLMPEHKYDITVDVVDQFERESSISSSITTGKMPSRELNFYHFQDKYSVTSPEKTTLTYAGVNMEYVNMQICELSAENMMRTLDDKPSYYDGPDAINNCINTITKKIELPKLFWVKNYFQVKLSDYVGSDFGHYMITFWHPDYRQQWGDKKTIYERNYVSITNLSVVEKKVNVQQRDNSYGELSDENRKKLQNLYWATNSKTLEPIKGARIDLFNKFDRGNDSLSKAETVFTNNDGVARSVPYNYLSGFVVTFGSDSAIISDAESRVKSASTARDASKFYLYTDRPIYKPGHEVHIKGLYRVGYDGEYQVLAGSKIPVKVFNAQNQEIFNQELEINNFGTVNTTLMLDTKASLGTYRIEAKGNSAHFDVEEYVPAAFKVDVETEEEEYISGDTMELRVDADYYFGVPVEGGEVGYSIASQNYNFDKYTDGHFSFGSSWYYCYRCSYGDKFVLRNTQNLESDGTANITQKLDLDELFADEDESSQSKIITVYVTVKNINGEAVSTQKSFIVHRGEFYLGIKSSQSFAGKNQELTAKVKSVDTQGAPKRVRNINIAISKVDWVYHKRQQVDGGYYYKYEKQLEKVKQWTSSTDGNGNWDGKFSIPEAGQYELSISSKDSRGNIVKDTSHLYIYGEEQVSVKPTNDATLEVITDNSAVSDGDKANIIITSPYEQAKALITLERGKVFEYHIIDIDQSIYQHTFNITREHIPNVVASVTLLSSDPEVKYGQVEFSVNTDERELNIDIASDKDKYLPGEDVSLSFLVTDRDGQGAHTELSVAVADLSVLALKGNPKKNPLPFFYGGFPHTITTVSNIKNVLHEIDVPSGTKGGGGADPDDLAKKKRGIFKDTAFWQAVLVTGQDGRAQANFTLPDNLTTWQVELVGITQDTKVGVAYDEFVARKQVMVTPLKPRFIVPGDTFLLGAKVFNQTGKRQKLDIQLYSDTLEMDDDKDKKKITLSAGETSTVYFGVKAPNDWWFGKHSFVMLAENDDFKDEVEQQVKVRRNDTYETVATAGASPNSVITEHVFLPSTVVQDKGELSMKHSATLAVFLSDALNSLMAFPYGCSEQVASKLDALAIIKQGLDIKNIGDTFTIREVEFEGVSYTLDELVEVGLMRLYENQKSDGSFGYYPNTRSSMYVTLHIANTLKQLDESGYSINKDSLNNAFKAINGYVNSREFNDSHDFAILSAYTAYSIGKKKDVHDFFKTRVKQILKDNKVMNEGLSNETLSYLALLLVQREDVFGGKSKDMVFSILENKIDVDARGAFLPVNHNRIIWQYHETPIKDTATLLKAFVLDERDSPIIDRMMRWLLSSRSKDGAWGTTNSTLSVVDAFTDYMTWKRENESKYTLSVSLNGKEKNSFDYGKNNILSQNQIQVPVPELEFDELNIVNFTKTNQNNRQNNVYYDVALKYFLPVDKISPRDEGFAIERVLYALDDKDGEFPLDEVLPGDVLRGEMKIIVPRDRNFVAIEDFIPAGVELINFNLETTDKSLQAEFNTKDKHWYYYPGKRNRTLRPDIEELRDDRLYLFAERLPAGQYTYTYFVRALVPGKFHHLPAVVSEMYFPENFARTRGDYFTVLKE